MKTPGAKVYSNVEATGYFPTPPPSLAKTEAERRKFMMEGGDNDRRGFPLEAVAENSEGKREIGFTLGRHIRGECPFVACAMDPVAGLRYGTAFRCPELEAQFDKRLTFLVVDSGLHFKGRGMTAVDICCDDEDEANGVIGKRKITLVAFNG